MPELKIISKGKEYMCLYDEEDHDLISRFTWSLNTGGYAVTSTNGRAVLMHRMILGIVDRPEIQVDHKFHNKIDNRRSQIRTCTPSENNRNSRKFKGSSKFKGVYKDGKYYHTQISISGCVYNLGRYHSETTAAKVYDNVARLEFREFALLNFPEYTEPKQLIFEYIEADS